MCRIVGVMAVLLLVGCQSVTSAASDPRIKQLLWLERADVTADFHRHVLAKHDTRFIAVYGYATDIPGVAPERQHRLVRLGRVRYIEGTSDNITSPEYGRLVKKAESYARRYNEMLLQYLRDHPDG